MVVYWNAGAYTVIRDSRISIEADTDPQRSFAFRLPKNLSDADAVLSFMVDRTINASMIISINGHRIVNRPFADGGDRSTHESFPGIALREGANQIVFECSSGSMRVSDVVLWYTRRVADYSAGWFWPRNLLRRVLRKPPS